MRSFLPPQWVLSCSFNQHPFLSFLALLLLPAVPASTFLTCGPAKPWHIPCCNNPSKNLLCFPCFWQLYPGKFCEAEILQIRNQEKRFFKALCSTSAEFLKPSQNRRTALCKRAHPVHSLCLSWCKKQLCGGNRDPWSMPTCVLASCKSKVAVLDMHLLFYSNYDIHSLFVCSLKSKWISIIISSHRHTEHLIPKQANSPSTVLLGWDGF